MLKVGQEDSISYKVKAMDKVDRLAVLNIAEIFPSFGDLDLSNNISRRGGPVITPHTVDFSQA